MYFNKSLKKTNFSFLAAIILLTAVVLAAFGTINSFANNFNIQKDQTSKLGLQSRMRAKIAGRKSNQPFGFAEKKSPFTFSAPAESLLGPQLAGDLDTTFGTGGKTTTQIGSSNSEALAIVLQPDGRFVAAGYTYNGANMDFALVRYSNNGTLETTFGAGGKVVTDIGGADNASLALAIQPDGKLIAAGSSFNGTDEDFALARYNSNGTLDDTFGTGGIVTTNFNNSSETIDAIAVQPDGRIVVAGYHLSGAFFRFALARYNTNGTLDETFGTGGKVTTQFTNFDDLARALALQPDGKIVVAGEADGDFAAARYNSNGSLDETFSGDGRVATSINLFDSAYDVAVQIDGKIVAAGETGNGNNSDFALVRYDSVGALDATFDGDGIVTTSFGSEDEFASSLALQAGGNIIAGGFSFNGSNTDFALVRYTSTGSLDSTFGMGGKVTTDFGTSSYDFISAMAIQSGNRIVAVGSANTNFALAAYSLGSSKTRKRARFF